MYRRSTVLVIIIPWLVYMFIMPCRKHIGIAHGIVFIEDILREKELILKNCLSFIDLYNKPSPVQDKVLLFLVVQNAALLRTSVGFYHISHFIGVGINKVKVAPHQISTGLLCLLQHKSVHIRIDPVVGIDKADPLTFCYPDTNILGSTLMLVDLTVNDPEFVRVPGLIPLQNLQ